MKVYRDDGGEKRLIGRADIPATTGPVYTVPLFGATSAIVDHYTIGTVTHLPADTAPIVERAVLLAHGQQPEFLPGWQPLAS